MTEFRKVDINMDSIPAHYLKPVELEPEEEKTPFELEDFDSFIKGWRPTQWLIQNYIASNELGMIFGAPTAGKTMVTLDMACRVATGMDWQGMRVKQSSVVYIAGEDTSAIRGRAMIWAQEHNVQGMGQSLHFSKTRASLNDWTEASRVSEALRGLDKPPRLIIVDTMAANNSGDENSVQDISSMMNNVIDYMVKPFNATVIFLHHTGRDNKDRARGSSAVDGAVRFTYHVEKGEDGYIRMHHKEGNNTGKPKPVMWEIGASQAPEKDNMGCSDMLPYLIEHEYEEPEEEEASAKRSRSATVSGRAKKMAEARDAVALRALSILTSNKKSGAEITIRQWYDEARENHGLSKDQCYRARDNLEKKGAISVAGMHVNIMSN